MKIESNEFVELIRNGAAGRSGGVDQTDQGFAKLLQEKAETASPESGPAAGGVNPLLSSGLVGQILAVQSLDDKYSKVDQQLESTLDQMDRYAAALGNGAASLREVEPLAQELEKSAGRLAEMSRGLPDDSPLKDLSNEAAVLATVEALKFKRGDYV